MDSLDWIVVVAGVVNLVAGVAIIVTGGMHGATALGLVPAALGGTMLGAFAQHRWGR